MDKPSHIEIYPNEPSTWHQLITETKQRCHMQTHPRLDHYLALTLDHFNQNQLPLKRNIAQHFLLALQTEGRVGIKRLQSVGDQCLLIRGLYPHLIERKQVSAAYITEIGRMAYHGIATHPKATIIELEPELFDQLSCHFCTLVQLLEQLKPPTMQKK